MAVDTGSKPVLFAHDNIPWPLPPTNSIEAASKTERTKTFPAKLDSELAAVWVATSTFCTLVNRTAATPQAKARITEQDFLTNMGAIMYRLLHQRYTPGSLDEAFRLGLLAFSSPIFLNWNRVELPDPRFTSAYRQALAELENTNCNITPQEHLWLLMVAAVSMTHEPAGLAWLAPRLRTAIDMCGMSIWDSLRALLTSFLWVGLVYDHPGKGVFESVLMPPSLCM